MEKTDDQGTPQISFSREPVRNFNEIVCQAIDDTLREVVGSKAEVVYMHLKYKFGIDRTELPYRIDTVCSILEFALGVKGAHVIERKVAKRVYDRILLPFHEEQGLTLRDFLKLAKETISRDSYYT